MKIIQIVGMPRSGTTALSNWLAMHEGIRSIPETHYLNIKILNGKISGIPKNLTNEEVIKSLVIENGITGYKEFIRKYIEQINIEATVIVESTPSHVLHIEKILSDVDCIVFLYRDCKSVCSSLKNVHWGDKGTIDNAYRWLRYQRMARKALQNKQVEYIEYDDFCKRNDGFKFLVSKIEKSVGLTLTKRTKPDTNLFLDNLSLEPWKKDSINVANEYKPKKHKNLSILETLTCFAFELINMVENYISRKSVN